MEATMSDATAKKPKADPIADAEATAASVKAKAEADILAANALVAEAEAKVEALKAEALARSRAADAKLRAERLANFAGQVSNHLISNDIDSPYQVPNSVYDDMRRKAGLIP
jgi:hypothetical protein